MGRLCNLHVCALGNTADYVPLSGCTVHNITQSLMHIRRMKREWMTLLNDLQPDVVHVNCCWMPQCALVTRWTDQWRRHLTAASGTDASGKRCLLLLTPHGMLEPWIISRNYWTRKVPAICLYQRRAVSRVDMIVATAESERQNILKLGWNQIVTVVKNGIDVKGIQPKTAWHTPHRLLFMSRLHPKKGLEMLFDAYAGLLKSVSENDNRDNDNPDNQYNVRVSHSELLIAGEGDPAYASSLRGKVRALGIDGHVRFLGPVYGDEKWSLIREADVVVLPSYSENYGLIVAESLASATPVLTTTGTPWKSLADHCCGWWVEPDVQTIRKALQDVFTVDGERAEKLGRNARLLAEQECSIEDNIIDLYQLYVANL